MPSRNYVLKSPSLVEAKVVGKEKVVATALTTATAIVTVSPMMAIEVAGGIAAAAAVATAGDHESVHIQGEWLQVTQFCCSKHGQFCAVLLWPVLCTAVLASS